LPHAGGADHQDVLGIDLLAHRAFGESAGGASGCAARWRRRAWRPVLADDEAVKLRDDLAGGIGGRVHWASPRWMKVLWFFLSRKNALACMQGGGAPGVVGGRTRARTWDPLIKS
jgi:hypothetical protein